jgi:ribA/ribD-fused uncharacterized protein
MYSRDELIAAIDGGEKIKWIHFWGHQPQQDGSLGPGCLSQWWPAPFTVEGIEYATAEHWMMVEKAKLFHDDSAIDAILAAPSPAAAKALGQKVTGFDEAAWTASRFDIVARGNVEKFASSDALRSYLIGTGNRVLVEASPVDRIWGIGLDTNHKNAKVPTEWRGLNLLGFALMQARSILAERL